MSEEFIPLTIYQSKQIHKGINKLSFDFGAVKSQKNTDSLCNYDEHFITREILKAPYPISSLLQSIGITFPQCWLLIEIKTNQLIKNWKYTKPGDIDIIAGNISNNKFLFNNIYAIQVKLRKTSAEDKLKSFPSGRGAEQTFKTALMGFDKTLLLHCFTRESKSTTADYADSWNPIINTDFFRAIKASKAILNKELTEKRSLYGFAVLGWGQAYGCEWNECGGFSDELIYEPPFKPLSQSLDVSDHRYEIEESIRELLANRKIEKYPFILDSQI
ncbi:MAG: hypothetical protein IT280_12470 [Ignavibacteria bacterium]|nr:hypothetical protein [Ignavibacteria bacterium]